MSSSKCVAPYLWFVIVCELKRNERELFANLRSCAISAVQESPSPLRLVGKLEVVPVSLVIVQDGIHNYIAPAFGSVCFL